jgi:transposase-like protein
MLHKATIRNVNRALKEVNCFHWEGDFKQLAKEALKNILEDRMEQDLCAYVGLDTYERGGNRTDYRNGSYTRHLLCEIGDLTLRVPRTRNKGFYPSVIEAYKRRHMSIDKVILACFVLGLSTRKAAKVLAPMIGETISASTVSEIAKCLDKEVERYHKRQLQDRYRFLFFDGVVLKNKGSAKVQRRPLLCAYGITHEGICEMIDFQSSQGESQSAWEGFLNDLYKRGLTGDNCELIITDGGKGLHSALEFVYPKIQRQRCWAHKTRNILDKVRKKDWEVVKKTLHRIFYAKNRREATKAYWVFLNKWRSLYPNAVKCLETDIEDLLTFFNIKEDKLWSKIRTTNAIERAFREVKRRTRPIGVFTNRESVERIVFAVFHHLNVNWENRPLKEFTHKD